MTAVATALRRLLSIRYEDGPWSLARVDSGTRYGLKSLLHIRRAATDSDREHWASMARYVAQFRAAQRVAPNALRVAAAGDLMWVPRGWERAFTPAVASVLGDADVRLCNLETPADPEARVPRWTYARFNAPTSFLDDWTRRIGPTVFSSCNNHALDQGLEGLIRTRAELIARGSMALGGPERPDATAMVQCGAFRVAVVGMTYGINPWGHGLSASELPRGIPRIRFGSPEVAPDWGDVERLLWSVRETEPDLVVIMPHWGFEFEYWPESLQREHAYRLLALGADVVIGSSPHVLQPVDLVSINGRDPSCPVQLERPGPARMGVIAYSLGNFLSSMPTVACNTGGILSLQFSRRESNALDLDGIAFTPTVTHAQRGRRQARLLSEQPLEAHAERAREALGALCEPVCAETHG